MAASFTIRVPYGAHTLMVQGVVVATKSSSYTKSPSVTVSLGAYAVSAYANGAAESRVAAPSRRPSERYAVECLLLLGD